MAKDNQTNSLSTFCEGTTIIGEVQSNNDIRIDGNVQGKINSKKRIVVGNTAKIEGNIDCMDLDVYGTIIGDIEVGSCVSLKSSSVVKGNIRCKELIIEKGVIFNGNSTMTFDTPQTKNQEEKK